MSRLALLVVTFLVCCCSSPQPSTETTGSGEGSGTAPATPAVEEPATPPESTAGAAEAGQCAGEPWETTNRQEETGRPPAEYLACSAASDCVEARMVGCCGGYAVAVNPRYRHCIAERNSIANCRAHCAQARPGDTAPARTLSCAEGSCSFQLEDQSHNPVVRIPFGLGD